MTKVVKSKSKATRSSRKNPLPRVKRRHKQQAKPHIHANLPVDGQAVDARLPHDNVATTAPEAVPMRHEPKYSAPYLLPFAIMNIWLHEFTGDRSASGRR